MPALGFVGLGQYLDANRGVLADQFGQAKKKAADTMASGDLGADSDLSRQFGSEAALAGNAGGDPTSGANAFNAALAWGAYGPEYKTLSETLDTAAHPPPAPPINGGDRQLDPNSQQRQRPTPDQPMVPGSPNPEGGMPQSGPPPQPQSGGEGTGLRKTLRRVGI